jgi:hypothetical protein
MLGSQEQIVAEWTLLSPLLMDESTRFAFVLFFSLAWASTASIACGGRSADASPGGDAADEVATAYGGGIVPLGSLSAQDATIAATGPPESVDSSDLLDAPMSGPPFDAGPGGICDAPLGAGDLMIDELMIESVSGTGDHGEWLEVMSMLDCAVNLVGLRGETPRGAKPATFEIAEDLWLPANGFFVVADSADPAINHYLPGTVVAWAGNLGDVLRNEGSTVTLLFDDSVVDTLTYPNKKLMVGASLAFPATCDPSVRSDWTLWQTSTASWFSGFEGTPNAPNVDVACPSDTDP